VTLCYALVRVQLPDRPGALGLVASRIGAVKGDIVGIEVLTRDDRAAVDELAVVLPHADLVSTLRREVGEVDGVTLLHVEIVDRFPKARVDELARALEAVPPPARAELHRALVATTVHAPPVRELLDLLESLTRLDAADVRPR
jgi:hypothetical protein